MKPRSVPSISERIRCDERFFSDAGQNDWQEFKPLFGGGKIKICDTLRAVTPFGGLSVLIEFFARIGLVEQLENRQFYQPESPNHYDPGQILVGFMLSVIAGAQRFAHTNQLRADRALQGLLGLKRFPSDDTILNYFRRMVLTCHSGLLVRDFRYNFIPL